jgi:hypothetical protein
MALSHRRLIFFKSAMPSIIMLLPRETRKPSSPDAAAPAVASPSATRQATFLNGRSVQNHV